MMDHKFKVGDKVRVIKDGVLGVVTDIGYGAESDWDWRENPFYRVDFIDSDYCDSFLGDELESVVVHEMNQALNRLLFVVEQAVENGNCPFDIEEAFEEYERLRQEAAANER